MIPLRAAQMRASLDDLVRERNASAAPQSSIPAAMFGFSGLEPGTMLFKLSLFSHQPRRAAPPIRAAAMPAPWGKTGLPRIERGGRARFVSLSRICKAEPQV